VPRCHSRPSTSRRCKSRSWRTTTPLRCVRAPRSLVCRVSVPRVHDGRPLCVCGGCCAGGQVLALIEEVKIQKEREAAKERLAREQEVIRRQLEAQVCSSIAVETCQCVVVVWGRCPRHCRQRDCSCVAVADDVVVCCGMASVCCSKRSGVASLSWRRWRCPAMPCWSDSGSRSSRSVTARPAMWVLWRLHRVHCLATPFLAAAESDASAPALVCVLSRPRRLAR
jgi:hypothetical protein